MRTLVDLSSEVAGAINEDVDEELTRENFLTAFYGNRVRNFDTKASV